MVTYYVHAEAGDDSASGVRQEAAWRTLGRVQSHAWCPGLLPGDAVCLNSSSVFHESLYIDLTRSSGSACRPITVQAYGDSSSMPVIQPSCTHAIMLHAPKTGQAGLHFTIRGLHLIGNGCLAEDGKPITGLLVYNESPSKIAGLLAADLHIQGFSHAGLQTMRHDRHAGYITDVQVQRVCSNGNPGHAGLLQWTGSGIVLGGACRGVSLSVSST